MLDKSGRHGRKEKASNGLVALSTHTQSGSAARRKAVAVAVAVVAIYFATPGGRVKAVVNIRACATDQRDQRYLSAPNCRLYDLSVKDSFPRRVLPPQQQR